MKLSVICENAVVETEIGRHDHTLDYNNSNYSSGGENSNDRDWFITGDEDEITEPTEVEQVIKNHERDISSLKHSTKVGFKNVGDILQKILDRLDGLEAKLT